MKKTYLQFAVEQWSTVPAVEIADLTGKTVVIVGANAGIGFEAANHFARMNPAKLILACRSTTKGLAAISEIEKTGFKSCELWTVDLVNFSSVIQFAERFQRETGRLDILVMNAGTVSWMYEETVDGWESSLQVNYLGTALLSLLLLPHLVDTGKKFGSASRLVIVASGTHYWVNLPEDVTPSSNPIARLSGPDHRDSVSMGHRYIQTKLFSLFFVRALQERLQSITSLTVNAVDPGFCYSNLRSGLQGNFVNLANAITEKCLAWTPEQGSRQLVYGAIGGRDNEDRMKGAYVSLAAIAEPSDFVISEEGKAMQNQLWRETIEVLKNETPRLEVISREYLV